MSSQTPADRPDGAPATPGLAITEQVSFEAPSTNRAVIRAPACLGTTKSGRPCGGTPTTSSGGRYCPQHDPQFNEDQRNAWRRRGALATLQTRRAQPSALHSRPRPIASPDVTPASTQALPALPTPADIVLRWETIGDCRAFLETLGVEVVNRRMSVSIAEQMRKLCESTMRALDLALDAKLAAQLAGDE